MESKEIEDKKIAELQLEQLRQFNYILAHNLKSPVNNIVELIRIMKIDPGNVPVMNHIEVEAVKLQTSINQLRQILELDGDFKSGYQHIDLNDLLEQCKEILREEFTASAFVINAHILHENKLVGIVAYYQSILYNLLSNSIKYRKKGKPVMIAIETKDVGNQVEIKIKDDGKGFDSETSDNMFVLHSRHYDSRNEEGSGIGLYMVKTQVELHGGSIELRSKKNIGTEFTLSLPALS